MKKIFLVWILVGAGFGCSKQDWLAKIYLFRAEEAFFKAYTLRIQKEVPYEERLKYYRKACDYFSKAYRFDPHAFTLNRIGSATESCLRVEDFEREKQFREFEEKYIKKHPQEMEYGEAGAVIALE